MKKFFKKSQTAGTAASFIAIIAGFLLLYLFLIPPDLRNDLLNDQPIDDDNNKNNNNENDLFFDKFNKTLLSVVPGRIDYLKQSQFEHNIPSVYLYTTTSAKEELISNVVFVKNSIFDRENEEVTFDIPSLNQVDNLYFMFSLGSNANNKGVLSIYLNDNLIYSQKVKSEGLTEPLLLRKNFLKTNNVLRFEVSNVGYKFWTTNEYRLNNLRLFYDFTDLTSQESKLTFMLDESEKFNLQSAIFRFNADCNPHEVGVLDVRINNQNVFSSVPDCGSINQVTISPHILEAGQNNIVFEAQKGHYLIDQILIKTNMKSMSYPTYNFYIDESLFRVKKESTKTPMCGDVDGICPSDCAEHLDEDCCLLETSKYWCPILTENNNDRCRVVRSADDCELCPAGYVDKDGNVPELCEGMCGDNNDGDCPLDCNKNYDKNCCFEDSQENYWCSVVPKYGSEHRCKSSLHVSQCFICEEGDWISKEGKFDCPDEEDDFEETHSFREGYEAWLKMDFFDDGQRKAARIYVNGYQVFLDITGSEYERNIANYLEPGSNSIKIEPQVSNLDINKLEIEVKQK
ncbi:MAG: hypothetical protein ACOC3X_03330 [Nanoarchaeota archaeon]